MINKRNGKESKPWTNGLAFEPKHKEAVPDTSAIPWLRVKRKDRYSSLAHAEMRRRSSQATDNR